LRSVRRSQRRYDRFGGPAWVERPPFDHESQRLIVADDSDAGDAQSRERLDYRRVQRRLFARSRRR
jgi:hypothetical protein